ncbi:MAG: hypothetical protein OXI75_02920 [Rhodospirillales bacterium]|nr:hypothetical protein [Rhodospirillales bacterium]
MKIANVVLGDFCVKPDWSRLGDWLKKRSPDIVTLQKIGPGEPAHEEELGKVGYDGWYLYHKEKYRGVAILVYRNFLDCHGLSPPEELDRELPCDDRKESRFLTVRIGNLIVSSIYAPFPHSGIGPTVDWLNLLREHVDKRAYACQESVLCGDFNVPSVDTSHGRLNRVLGELKNLGYCDLYRAKYGNSMENRGHTRGYSRKCPDGTSRLHLILASKSMMPRLQSACVEVNSKPWPRKDAPPLVVDLEDSECGNR